MSSPIDRILLPIGPEGDRAHLLRSATVFSSWFDAPLQIACDDPESLPRYQVLAASLGVAIEPVLCFEDSFVSGLVAHSHSHGPAIIVTEPSAFGRQLAAESSQPVVLATDRDSARMPVGPLIVEPTGGDDDLAAMALAAVVAGSLDEPVRLVGDAASCELDEHLEDAEARLRQVGCEVGVDRIEAGPTVPLVVAGQTRRATGVVLPAGRLEEPGLLEAITSEGLNVFVAPRHDPDAGRPAPFMVDLSKAPDRRPPGARLKILDRDECLARLDRHSVARIGYQDGGWPIVVPINYRLHQGDVFIRSLAGGKLRAAERGDIVCLELDGYDEQLRTGWSVITHGALEVIGDPAVLREAWANDPDPWIAADDWQWLRMVPISITGREVAPSATDGTPANRGI